MVVPPVRKLPSISMKEEGEGPLPNAHIAPIFAVLPYFDLALMRLYLLSLAFQGYSNPVFLLWLSPRRSKNLYKQVKESLHVGMVKRIRGVAFSTKVSPQSVNRMVDGARGVLNALLADVYIFTDHMSGLSGGFSPGYGLTLVAETTAKNLISAESIADLTDKVGGAWLLLLMQLSFCNRNRQIDKYVQLYTRTCFKFRIHWHTISISALNRQLSYAEQRARDGAWRGGKEGSVWVAESDSCWRHSWRNTSGLPV